MSQRTRDRLVIYAYWLCLFLLVGLFMVGGPISRARFEPREALAFWLSAWLIVAAPTTLFFVLLERHKHHLGLGERSAQVLLAGLGCLWMALVYRGAATLGFGNQCMALGLSLASAGMIGPVIALRIARRLRHRTHVSTPPPRPHQVGEKTEPPALCAASLPAPL